MLYLGQQLNVKTLGKNQLKIKPYLFTHPNPTNAIISWTISWPAIIVCVKSEAILVYLHLNTNVLLSQNKLYIKNSQILDGNPKLTPFLKVPLYGETVEDAIRDLLDVDVSVDEDCLHLG